jgi:hypothetical protein
MRWIYDGLGGGHRGEYDHVCSNCKYKTWFASYTNPNRENVQCPKCKEWPKE